MSANLKADFVYRLPVPDRPRLRELTDLRLVPPVMTDDGREAPAVEVGTVAGIWADGKAYEVEFPQGLATVEAAKLVAVA